MSNVQNKLGSSARQIRGLVGLLDEFFTGLTTKADQAQVTAQVQAAKSEALQRAAIIGRAAAANGKVPDDLRSLLLTDAAHLRIWPGAEMTKTGAKIDTLKSPGFLGFNFAAVSTPDIEAVANGIKFNAGFLSWSGITAENYTGAMIMVDVTINDAPIGGTGTIFGLELQTGTTLNLRYTSTGIQALLPNGSLAYVPGGVSYGTRYKFGISVNYTTREAVLILPSSDVAEAMTFGGTANTLNLDQIRIGQNAKITLHDAAVFLTTSGMPDSETWSKVFGQPGRVVVNNLPPHVTVVDGQSGALATNSLEGRILLNGLAKGRVNMVDGLRNTANIPISLHGAGLSRLDPEVPAAGIVTANANGNHTLGYPLALSLFLHRERLGLPSPQHLTGFMGAAGQSIYEFDDDQPVQTGNAATGTTIHDNWRVLLSEMKRLSPSATAGLIGFCQGTANSGMAPGVWLAAAVEALQDRFGVYSTIFGALPRLIMFQEPGSTDTSGAAWSFKQDQVDLVKLYGGVLGCPLYPFPLGSDGVHHTWDAYLLAAETAAWAYAEIEAGRLWTVLQPAVSRSANVLTLTYDLRPDEQLERILRYGTAEPFWGYEVDGATITKVEQIGARTHRLTCSAQPTAVQYAMQRRNKSGESYSAHRGEVGTTLRQPSLLFPGQTLQRMAPGWRITL